MTALSTVRTDIRTELQEPTAGFWTDAELTKWINRSYMDLIRACKVEATSTLTLANGTESYSLPSDFYMGRRVELQSTAGSATNWFEVQPYDLNLRRPGDPLSSATFTSTPVGWYIFNNKIYFVPVPDLAYSGTLYYYKNATPLVADGDSFVYPEGVLADTFDPAVLYFAVGMALRKRQDSAYTTYLGDYAAARGEIIRDAGDRGMETPLIVHDDWMLDS